MLESPSNGPGRRAPRLYLRLAFKSLRPLCSWARREPQNEIGGWRRAAVTPEQLRALRPVPVRVHTDLHECFRNRAFAVRNERVLQRSFEVGLFGGGEPRGLLRLSTRVSLNERIKPRLLRELRPGTRVVSHVYDMLGWTADQRVDVDGRWVFLWTVPARK